MTAAGMFAMAFWHALRRAEWSEGWAQGLVCFGEWHPCWLAYRRGLTVPSGAEWRR